MSTGFINFALIIFMRVQAVPGEPGGFCNHHEGGVRREHPLAVFKLSRLHSQPHNL